MEKPLEESQAWQDCWMRQGSQGITRVGWTVLDMLMESTDLLLAWARPVGWELYKRTMAPNDTFVPRGIYPIPAPLFLFPKLVNLAPLHMSLVLLALPPLQWSPDRMSLWVNQSVCEPFKCSTLVSSSPLHFWDVISTSFHSRCCGASSSWHCWTGLGTPVWGWDPLLLR